MLVLLSVLLLSPNNTKIISNPNTEGTHSVTFTEDLRFGGDLDAGDEYLWMDRGRPSTFEIGQNGHFYIIDASNSRLLEFDKDGKFVKVFAQRGEGPGEFQGLTNFQILADGTAIGMDALQGSRKATYYDKDLKVLESKTVGSLASIPTSPYFSPDGSLFFSIIFSVKLNENAPPDTKFMSAIMNAKFEPVRELCGEPWPNFDQTKVGDKSYWSDFIGKQFDIIINKTTWYATFLSTGEVLVFDSKKYEIEVWNSDLSKQLMVIKKTHEPVFYDEEEKAALAESLEKTIYDQGLQNFVDDKVLSDSIEKANLPVKQNPIAGIVPMEDGHFFVVNRIKLPEGRISGDFFNREGKFLGKIIVPGDGLFELNTPMNASMRLVFKNGFAYTMTRNEDGDNQMVRYRYEIEKK